MILEKYKITISSLADDFSLLYGQTKVEATKSLMRKTLTKNEKDFLTDQQIADIFKSEKSKNLLAFISDCLPQVSNEDMKIWLKAYSFTDTYTENKAMYDDALANAVFTIKEYRDVIDLLRKKNLLNNKLVSEKGIHNWTANKIVYQTLKVISEQEPDEVDGKIKIIKKDLSGLKHLEICFRIFFYYVQKVVPPSAQYPLCGATLTMLSIQHKHRKLKGAKEFVINCIEDYLKITN